MINEANFEAFKAAYLIGLADAIEANPEEYARMVREDAPAIVDKMMRTMRERPYGVHYCGSGLRRACKILGIKHTRKAILAFLGIEVQP